MKLNPACRRVENIGNNAAWYEYAAVIWFWARDATAILSLLYAHTVALCLTVWQRALGALTESERAKIKKDELYFHRSTAEFISRLPMFSRHGSEGEEMPSISKFLICYTVHISPLLIYNKSILAKNTQNKTQKLHLFSLFLLFTIKIII